MYHNFLLYVANMKWCQQKITSYFYQLIQCSICFLFITSLVYRPYFSRWFDKAGYNETSNESDDQFDFLGRWFLACSTVIMSVLCLLLSTMRHVIMSVLCLRACALSHRLFDQYHFFTVQSFSEKQWLSHICDVFFFF